MIWTKIFITRFSSICCDNDKCEAKNITQLNFLTPDVSNGYTGIGRKCSSYAQPGVLLQVFSLKVEKEEKYLNQLRAGAR